jgi:hypothetical protein
MKFDGKFASEGTTTQLAQKAGHDKGFPISQSRMQERSKNKSRNNSWPTGPKY